MLNLTRSFTDHIDNRVSFEGKYVLLNFNKNECGDILRLASKFQNKSKLFDFLMNRAKLVPKYGVENHHLKNQYRLKMEKDDLADFKIYLKDTIVLLESEFNMLESKHGQGRVEGELSAYRTCNLI